MDENAVEKLRRRRFSDSSQPKKDNVKGISREEFENRLFDGGVYHFDIDQDVEELRMDAVRVKTWFDGNPGWDKKRTADDMVRHMNDSRYELAWRKQFDGKIPRRWLDWRDIGDDFKKAGKEGLQLSDGLINAGITCPHHLVANTVGKSQRLNLAQLVAALARPGIPPWNEDEIVEAQLRKGLNRADLRKARERAEEIKRKMRDRKEGKNQLREPWLELTKGDE